MHKVKYMISEVYHRLRNCSLYYLWVYQHESSITYLNCLDIFKRSVYQRFQLRKTLRVHITNKLVNDNCSRQYQSIPYSGYISREKIFAKASTCVLHEYFAVFYFCHYGKGCRIHYVIINAWEKVRWLCVAISTFLVKESPMDH